MYYQYSDRKVFDFLISSAGNSVARKRENLLALYSTLEYCEEPHLCRRLMQLAFLGESFEAADCRRMCDNCRRGEHIDSVDMTQNVSTLIRCVEDCQGRITAA